MKAGHVSRPATGAALSALLSAAYRADPRDRLISPIGDCEYGTLFGRIPAAQAVLRVAAQIEPEPAAVMDWYRQERIAEFGHLTAEQLVSLGRAEAVVVFLCSIRDGQRD